MHKFKIAYVDSGFCRIIYQVKNEKGEKIFYCLQDIGSKDGIGLFRCSQDGEPSYRIKNFFTSSETAFELPIINPKDDSDSTMNLKMRCIQFILKNFETKGE